MNDFVGGLSIGLTWVMWLIGTLFLCMAIGLPALPVCVLTGLSVGHVCGKCNSSTEFDK